MSLRGVWYSFLAAFGIAIVILGGIWFYVHRQDANVQTVAVHAVVDCLPFLASILFALWPEVSKAHIAWRVAIIIVGLAWSGLLVKKDYLDLQAAKRDEQNIVATAVEDANNHSDQQINRLRSEVKNQFSGLSHEVEEGDTSITGAMGKLMPNSENALVKFSLLPAMDINTPILSESLPLDKDGVVSVEFMATNISDVAASSLEFWVEICRECAYAKEPEKFERLNDTIPTIRHRLFGDLNPGISTDGMTIQIKPPSAPTFQVGFMYSCKDCGKRGPEQVATITPLVSASQ